MTVNDRLQQVIDVLYGGNKRAFSTAIGVNPTVIENIVGSRKGKPSYDVLFKICANANISEEWFVSGVGNMLKAKRLANEFPEQRSSESHHKVINNKGIEQELEIDRSKTRPRIPLEAAAGSLSVVTQSVSQSDCEMLPLIARIPDYDFTIMVKGDSMEPGFLSGDEVACRMIRERSFIQWGQPHVIDSYDGIVLKRIHDKGDKILCTSDNPAYGDFYIPKTDIYNLARVVGLIRQY